MTALKTFWTPCFFYTDIKSATTTVAFYTAMFSLIAITYTCYVMAGGESSQYYMPYFETDIRNSTQIAGAFAIVFFLGFFFSSIFVVRGIRFENRGMMLPWLICMVVAVTYQTWYSINMLWAYYIYLSTVLVVLVDWIWMAYNIYCGLCIYSQYQAIREKQSPQLIFAYP